MDLIVNIPIFAIWSAFSRAQICEMTCAQIGREVSAHSRIKNPAYRRQSISRPMRILTPIQKNPASLAKFIKNPTFFARRFHTLYEQKYSILRPLLSISLPQGFVKSKKFGHWTLESGGKKTFKWSEQIKKYVKNFFCRGNLRPFLSKNVQN